MPWHDSGRYGRGWPASRPYFILAGMNLLAPLRRFLARLASREVAAALSQLENERRDHARTVAAYADFRRQSAASAAEATALAGQRIAALTTERDDAALEVLTIKRELSNAREDLLGEQREHGKTKAALETAESQNERLWDIAERDRARVRSETAAFKLERAKSEVGADILKMSDEDAA